MNRNARLLYRHVTDLLDVAKLQAGGMRVRYTQSDLARVVQAAVPLFDPLAAERHIRFTVDGPDTLAVEMDTAQIERVLLNLLSNAFKFTPNSRAIRGPVRIDGDRAAVEVEDTGPGPRRPAIGDLRAVSAGRRRGRPAGGTGLGLAIVREFVELHGGNVGVTEAAGGGARFRFTLPLRAPADQAVQEGEGAVDGEIRRQTVEELGSAAVPAVATVDPPSRAPLVLVVEDNPEMNAYLVEVLGDTCRVATAFDGREGLAQARALRPDLIVSDLMMPRLAGDRMVAELRGDAEIGDIPVVLLTARADEETRVRLLTAGVDLTKPFSAGELRARVAGIVADRRRSMQALRESEERVRRSNAELEQRVLERGRRSWPRRTTNSTPSRTRSPTISARRCGH